MKSAGSLFAKYRLYVDKKCTVKSLNADRMLLIKGLRSAIGEIDQSNANKTVRIERYKELSQRMLGYEIPEYDEYAWFEVAINEKVRGLRDKSDSLVNRWDPLTDIYTWKNPRKYKETSWYKFQEAVKLNQDTTWDFLNTKVFSNLDLKDL
jgi:hypothetical protein